MNLVLLHEHDYINSGQVRLTGRRQAHISKILRKSVGETLQVGRLGGKIGVGTVLALSDSEVLLDIVTDQDPPPPQSTTLLLALPRPKVLKRIVQGVTSMGIKKIILFNTWRVEKSYWQSPLLNEESLHEQMVLGLEQARDTCLPEIWQRDRFKPFVEDELPKLVTGRRALVAHPNAVASCPCNSSEPTILAIGPEGGFLPYELNKLSDAGFQTVHLGQRALRVETAIPALLGRLLRG